MNKEFAVFILVYGRPEKEWTYKTLRKSGYTGKVYFVGDDLDVTINKYKKKNLVVMRYLPRIKVSIL